MKKMDECIVKELFERFDYVMERTQEQDLMIASRAFGRGRWFALLDPLTIEGFTQEDLDSELYDPLIDSLHQQFTVKFHKDWYDRTH